MSTHLDVRSQPGGAPSIEVGRVKPAQQDEALSLLLTGRLGARQAVAVQLIDDIKRQRTPLDEFWAARHEGQLRAVMLFIPNPGRTAMSFICPIRDDDTVVFASQLVRVACEGLDPVRVGLVQALLDHQQRREAKALTMGGFTELASLLYMHRPLAARDQDALTWGAISHPMRLVTWSEANRGYFAKGIEASYEATLDCPQLVGVRGIDDIIAGHMAAGQFTPDLWFALLDGDEPAAVMLLNPTPERGAIELVYLGVAPRWRGGGIGRQLLNHALAASTGYGAHEMLLAVDEDNAPALGLYRSMRFAPKARKLALIRTLPSPI